MKYKVGVRRMSDIVYNGYTYPTSKDYWTTVEANGEREAKIVARHNLAIQMAINEIFIGKVNRYKGIYIDLSDMEIGK